MKILLASLIALTPVSAVAGEYQEGYSTSRNCFKTEYREEHVPGTADNPAYVLSFNEPNVEEKSLINEVLNVKSFKSFLIINLNSFLEGEISDIINFGLFDVICKSVKIGRFICVLSL